MQSKFLLLLATCALATALPLAENSGESHSTSESHKSGEVESTTTGKPLPSKIIAIKDAADLENRISQAGDKVVIIFAIYTWCPFCKRISPEVEDIAAKTENLIVLKVDREDKSISKYGLSDVRGVPTFIFIKDGVRVKQIYGSNADIRGTLSKISPTNDRKIADRSE